MAQLARACVLAARALSVEAGDDGDGGSDEENTAETSREEAHVPEPDFTFEGAERRLCVPRVAEYGGLPARRVWLSEGRDVRWSARRPCGVMEEGAECGCGRRGAESMVSRAIDAREAAARDLLALALLLLDRPGSAVQRLAAIDAAALLRTVLRTPEREAVIRVALRVAAVAVGRGAHTAPAHQAAVGAAVLCFVEEHAEGLPGALTVDAWELLATVQLQARSERPRADFEQRSGFDVAAQSFGCVRVAGSLEECRRMLDVVMRLTCHTGAVVQDVPLAVAPAQAEAYPAEEVSADHSGTAMSPIRNSFLGRWLGFAGGGQHESVGAALVNAADGSPAPSGFDDESDGDAAAPPGRSALPGRDDEGDGSWDGAMLVELGADAGGTAGDDAETDVLLLRRRHPMAGDGVAAPGVEAILAVLNMATLGTAHDEGLRNIIVSALAWLFREVPDAYICVRHLRPVAAMLAMLPSSSREGRLLLYRVFEVVFRAHWRVLSRETAAYVARLRESQRREDDDGEDEAVLHAIHMIEIFPAECSTAFYHAKILDVLSARLAAVFDGAGAETSDTDTMLLLRLLSACLVMSPFVLEDFLGEPRNLSHLFTGLPLTADVVQALLQVLPARSARPSHATLDIVQELVLMLQSERGGASSAVDEDELRTRHVILRILSSEMRRSERVQDQFRERGGFVWAASVMGGLAQRPGKHGRLSLNVLVHVLSAMTAGVIGNKASVDYVRESISLASLAEPLSRCALTMGAAELRTLYRVLLSFATATAVDPSGPGAGLSGQSRVVFVDVVNLVVALLATEFARSDDAAHADTVVAMLSTMQEQLLHSAHNLSELTSGMMLGTVLDKFRGVLANGNAGRDARVFEAVTSLIVRLARHSVSAAELRQFISIMVPVAQCPLELLHAFVLCVDTVPEAGLALADALPADMHRVPGHRVVISSPLASVRSAPLNGVVWPPPAGFFVDIWMRLDVAAEDRVSVLSVIAGPSTGSNSALALVSDETASAAVEAALSIVPGDAVPVPPGKKVRIVSHIVFHICRS